MKKSILSLEGITLLSKNERKNILGGKNTITGPDTCTATCADGAKVGTSSCDAAAVACSQNGGSSGCECGGKGPLDPPGEGF